MEMQQSRKSLTEKEFESFWQAIEFVEKWVEGEEEFIEKWIISGVHKKSGVISEYFVQKPHKSIWVTKEEAICLASERRLHVVVVHLKNGTVYLRPEYGSKPFEAIA